MCEPAQAGAASDKGMIHFPGWREWDGTKFHHAAQNGLQFKTYELLLEFSI